MAKEIRCNTIFEEGCIPIVVMPTEHHQKVMMHSHSFVEFVFIDKGFALHTCNGTTTILTSGDLFVIQPDEDHSYISAHHTYLYNVLFLPEILQDVMGYLKPLPGMHRIFEKDCPFEKLHLSLTEKQEILSFLDKMRWEGLNKPVGWELKLKSLLEGFLVYYSRLYNNSFTTKEEKSNFLQIYKVLQFVEEHYTEDFGVKEMAAVAGLSSDYMSKLFKNIIGMSPAEYARNFRLAKSMELLKTTDRSIAQISDDLGFTDISVFSRQFKQIVGTSPSAFRKE